jgi:N-acyl-D-aspartate/D-glutamate deacylase
MPQSLPDAIARPERGGIAPDTAFLVGFNTLRSQVLGSANRAPAPAELARMQELAIAAMNAGEAVRPTRSGPERS